MECNKKYIGILLRKIFSAKVYVFLELLKKSIENLSKKSIKIFVFGIENYFYNFSRLCFTRGNL